MEIKIPVTPTEGEDKKTLSSVHVEIDTELFERFRKLFPQKGMITTVVRVKLAEFVGQAEKNMSGALKSIFDPTPRDGNGE